MLHSDILGIEASHSCLQSTYLASNAGRVFLEVVFFFLALTITVEVPSLRLFLLLF